MHPHILKKESRIMLYCGVAHTKFAQPREPCVFLLPQEKMPDSKLILIIYHCFLQTGFATPALTITFENKQQSITRYFHVCYMPYCG